VKALKKKLIDNYLKIPGMLIPGIFVSPKTITNFRKLEYHIIVEYP